MSFWGQLRHGITTARANKIDAGVFVACVVSVAILIRLLVPIVPQAFTLEFNSYALISLAGLVLDLCLLIILLRRPSHSGSILWFALFIVFGSLWSASEALERMATTPVGAVYWGDIISGITVYLPACFFLFVRSYTNRSHPRTTFWVPTFIFGTAAIIAALLSGNNVFRLPAVSERMPWGYPGPNSVVSVLFIIWAAVLTIAAVARLIVFFRRATTAQDRRQSMIFIISASALLVVSGLTEVLLPMLGISWIPPLGVFSNALLALSVIMGIHIYGGFSVGIDEIAETVLATMGDGVVVTNSDYHILYSNGKAEDLLRSFDSKPLAGLDLMSVGEGAFEASRVTWESELEHRGTAGIDDLQLSTLEHEVTVNLRVTQLQSDQSGYIFVLSDVSQLRRTSDEVKEQAAKLGASNKAYQDSQAAMLNLLEDARELETELKSEKASVERKVAERTNELQAERESLETIINGVDFGIYMLGPDLHVSLVNKAMQELYTQAFHKPYSLQSFDADVHSLPDTQADIKEALKTHLAVRRAEFIRGDRVIRSFRSPIYQQDEKKPKLLGMVNVMQDITDAKAAERSRDEFFSIASHELRTPLTAIRGNTSMIQEYFAEQIKDPSLKEMIGDIHNSSVRLITLVNDFLNTSRLEQGKIVFKIEPFDLPDLIAEVIKEFKAGDSGAKVPIEAKPSGKAIPTVLADRDRLKEVIINLISNAVKFTEKGAITISVATDDNKIKVRVTDTGHGIPEESRGLLFRKFQQASNNTLTRDNTRSTGLGLYISKLIVTGMGGEIGLEKSEVEKGSTFAVTLPTATALRTPRAKVAA